MSNETETQEYPWYICDCCGEGVAVGEESPNKEIDLDRCWCKSCGGATETEMGFAQRTFFDARITVLEDTLSGENRKNFLTSSYDKKCFIISKLVQKGHMI